MTIPLLKISVQILVPDFDHKRGYERVRTYSRNAIRQPNDNPVGVVRALCNAVISDVEADHQPSTLNPQQHGRRAR